MSTPLPVQPGDARQAAEAVYLEKAAAILTARAQARRAARSVLWRAAAFALMVATDTEDAARVCQREARHP